LIRKKAGIIWKNIPKKPEVSEMKARLILMSILLIGLIYPAFQMGSVGAEKSPVLFKGSLCEGVQYQKSIEAVTIKNGTIYAACDYRMVTGKELVGIYYLGEMGAYSMNGSRLWSNDSGYVVKILPIGKNVIDGSLGGFVVFNNSGKIIETLPTLNKLYDFTVNGSRIYAVDGEVWVSNGSFSTTGHLYMGRILPNGTVELNGTGTLTLNFSSLLDRVALGSVIYVGSGMPSGYSFSRQFGGIFGVSYDGRVLWNVSTGKWVRDVVVWNGNAVAGTDDNSGNGNIIIIDKDGHVLKNVSTFAVQDMTVEGETLYIAGVSEDGKGKVAAYRLKDMKKLWEVEMPYRAKVVTLAGGKLAVGIGEFKSEKEGNTTKVYSEGGLYILNPSNGKILWKDMTMGYVRSLAAEENILVAGTGSQYFYVLDVSKTENQNGICGPAFLILLVVLIGGLVRGGGRFG
jgi:hypothetical protein